MSITLLLPTLFSCAKDVSTGYTVKERQLKTTVNKIFENLDSLAGTSEIQKSGLDFEFTQESVDYYTGLLGYNPGDFSVETIESMAQQLGVVSQEGLSNFLIQHNITPGTKDLLVQILNGSPITDLSNFPEYLSKSQDEKELIELANIFILEAISQGRGCTFWGGVGAVLGALLGGAACTPVCIILGGVVGGLFGCDLGGGKGSDDDSDPNL